MFILCVDIYWYILIFIDIYWYILVYIGIYRYILVYIVTETARESKFYRLLFGFNNIVDHFKKAHFFATDMFFVKVLRIFWLKKLCYVNDNINLNNNSSHTEPVTVSLFVCFHWRPWQATDVLQPGWLFVPPALDVPTLATRCPRALRRVPHSSGGSWNLWAGNKDR
jgi:hypothetical protein